MTETFGKVDSACLGYEDRTLQKIPREGPAQICEISYGSVKGTLSCDPIGVSSLALIINSEVVAETLPSRHFELDVHRALVPNEKVEVLVRNASGQAVQILEWGHAGPDVPENWCAGGGPRYPSFFLLGAAKSATTSLHIWLDAHPYIFMSRPKEPFYFEAEYSYGPAFYFRKYFSAWKGQRVVGESRHRNLYLPFVPKRIHESNPEAKLLVILRNPARRAVSHWWHWRSIGLETLPLGDALRADLERIERRETFESEEEAAAYADFLRGDQRSPHRAYLDSGYYADQLERYITLFGRDKLLVLFFEDLIADPQRVHQEAYRFLEVNPTPEFQIDYPVLNASVPGAFEHVDKNTEAFLIEHYRAHNRRLEDLLGVSKSHWNLPFRSIEA